MPFGEQSAASGRPAEHLEGGFARGTLYLVCMAPGSFPKGPKTAVSVKPIGQGHWRMVSDDLQKMPTTVLLIFLGPT